MTSIMIADDHPLITESLNEALVDAAGLYLSGTYGNAAQLLRALQKVQPDMIILDLHLPDKSGSELVPVILKIYPAIMIIILSAEESLQCVKEMMQLGCKGYLLKSRTRRDSLITAIKKVMNGEIYIDEAIKNEVLAEIALSDRRGKCVQTQITQREQEILILIADNLTNQEIADRLFISLRTVETHRYNLYQKLSCKNTMQLLKTAREAGLISHRL